MTARIIRLAVATALLAALVCGRPAEGIGAESFFGFSFKEMQSPLFASDKSFSAARESEPRYSHYSSYSALTDSTKETAGKGNDSSWNEIDYKNFRFSLNSMLAEPSLDRDYRRLVPADQLDASQIFPLIFQGSYRDSLQSMGKMVEPQVRMEIRF